MPSRAQLAEARAVALAASERLKGKIEILFVRPDYDVGRPRACMDGWARRYVVVTPDGTALPCHQAASITALSFENVRDRSLGGIWDDSAAFRAYRGEAWMPDPCRTCDERHRDFGGCRCQAFALTGDAGATDPACDRAPRHELVTAARLGAERPVAPLAPIRLRRMRAG
jgi:pyrroloquinoline quinone biosynthesis protein E